MRSLDLVNGLLYCEVKKADIYTTQYENKIRSEMELPSRTHYAIFPEGCDNPSQMIDPNTRRSLYYNVYY